MAFHLSDRDLLLTVDHELAPRRDGRMREHLAACASCADRLRTIERTLADTSRLFAPASGPLPSAAAARARLRARLGALAQEPADTRLVPSTTWGMAAAAVLIASIGLTWMMAGPLGGGATAVLAGDVSRQLARFELTPGAARQVSPADLCGDQRPSSAAVVPASVHRHVFASYGADVSRSSDYELDYLITPELGGTPDPRNLWPQPFGGTVWSAYVKDELELYLHQQVCAGAMDVATAQQEIATDWIAAYKRHFKTDRPRRDYAQSPLTEADGDLLRAELEELGIAAHPEQSGAMLMALLVTARDASGPARGVVND